MFILRIYLVCSRRCISISIDGTSYKVEVGQHNKPKKMSNMVPTKKKRTRGELRYLRGVSSSCFLYIQSSPVKVLAVIEERKHLCKK